MEERARLIVDTATEYAIYSLDHAGRVLDWNRGAARQLGWTADEIIGRHFEVLFMPEDRAAGIPARELEYALGSNYAEDNRWHLRKDGSRIYVHGVTMALRDAQGDHLGFFKIMRDRTEWLRQQEALLRALDAASRADQARRRLLAVAGHDLRQPIQTITSALILVRRKAALDDAERRWLDSADKALDELSAEINQLAEAARRGGDLDPIATPVQVGPIMKEVATSWASAASTKGLELRVIDTRAVVVSDRTMLATILRNLVNNAVKYTQQGRIVVGCRHHGNELSIEVHDTGIGIRPEHMGGIFDEFTRLDPVSSPGLGLGLSIVKRTADVLGHRVTLRSVVGRGSCFAVYAPLNPPADMHLRRS